MSNNNEELNKIAHYIFPLSMCSAYQFRDDLIRVIDESSAFYITNEINKQKYIVAFKKMNELTGSDDSGRKYKVIEVGE